MKRIMTIQDISCIGKCSLTVALPIISSLGIEAAIVPTAVLSTHTGFKGFTFRDLTEDLEPIKDHWKKEGFTFDAIYTGYLGSIRQIDIVKDYFNTFATEDTLKIVDPAMADNGRLYVGFDEAFADEMTSLCGSADIILPNISEAAIMTHMSYPGEDASYNEVKKLLEPLAKLGAKKAIITGVTLEDGSFGFIGIDSATGETFEYGTKKTPYRSHGTGDIFASTFSASVVKGYSVYDALCIAADFTGRCISNTYKDPNPVTYAVNMEAELPYLLKRAGVL